MTSPLPAPTACPWYLPVIVEDKSSAVKGRLTTYLIDCGRSYAHEGDHRASNGRAWTDAEGRTKRQ